MPLSEPTYAQQSVPIFECRVSVEVTNQLLEDAAFNLASELSADFAEEFGRLEGAAFVNGNGTTRARGLPDLERLYDQCWRCRPGCRRRDRPVLRDPGSLRGQRHLGDAAGDDRRRAQAPIRSGTGPYIWVDSIAPGTPASLLGRPVVEMPDMSTVGSPADTTIAFGDWIRAYRIFDRVGLEVLRDPYSLARNSIVCFHARQRVGGALVDGAAVKGLSALTADATSRATLVCHVQSAASGRIRVSGRKAQRLAAIDRQRPGPRRRGYDREWEAYRAAYLQSHPSCVECGAPAAVVDHVRPVRDGGSFWDPANHSPLCRACHAAKTMRDVNARMKLWA